VFGVGTTVHFLPSWYNGVMGCTFAVSQVNCRQHRTTAARRVFRS
jgi:hypothetical protein